MKQSKTVFYVVSSPELAKSVPTLVLLYPSWCIRNKNSFEQPNPTAPTETYPDLFNFMELPPGLFCWHQIRLLSYTWLYFHLPCNSSRALQVVYSSLAICYQPSQ